MSLLLSSRSVFALSLLLLALLVISPFLHLLSSASLLLISLISTRLRFLLRLSFLSVAMRIFARFKDFRRKEKAVSAHIKVRNIGAMSPLLCSPYACRPLLTVLVKSEVSLVRWRFGRYVQLSHAHTSVLLIVVHSFAKAHTDRSAEYVLPELLRDAVHDPEVLCIRLSLRISSATSSRTVRIHSLATSLSWD